MGVNVTTRGAMLDNGTLDATLATFTITDARKKTYDFSRPYYIDHIGVLVLKSRASPIWRALTARPWAWRCRPPPGQAGAAAAEAGITLKFAEYATYPEIKIALVARRVDAFSVDSSILLGYQDDSTYLLPTQFAPQEYGVATKKDGEYSGPVDEAIAAMEADGTLRALKERWGLSLVTEADVEGAEEAGGTGLGGGIRPTMGRPRKGARPDDGDLRALQVGGALCALARHPGRLRHDRGHLGSGPRYRARFRLRLRCVRGVALPHPARLTRVYVETVQSIPLLLQVFVLYAVFPLIGLTIASFWIGVIAIGAYHGGYMSEVVRSGIGSVHRGQFEAAKSQGFSPVQTMTLIILPQAMRIILPPLAVQAANLVKNTSVLALIAGGELMYFANSFAGDTSYYGPAHGPPPCCTSPSASRFPGRRVPERRMGTIAMWPPATPPRACGRCRGSDPGHPRHHRACGCPGHGRRRDDHGGRHEHLGAPVADKGRYLTYAELYGIDAPAWPDRRTVAPRTPRNRRGRPCAAPWVAPVAVAGQGPERRPEMSDIAALLTWTNIRFLGRARAHPHYLGAGHRLLYRARRRHLHHARILFRLLRGFAIAYVELFKNTPLLLWIMFTFFVAQLPPLPAAVLAFTLFTAASVAEIVRGGLASVPAGQYEAARSQGFSAPQMYLLIILPQALRNMVPALLSQFVTTIKDTSYLWGAMALQELMGRGMILMNSYNSTVQIFAIFGIMALIYFVVCFTLSQIVRAYQRRLKGAR
ncbi:MAG: ABC transporter substrate-binding protein/permease [Adlercreutzia equolifaciens]